MNKIYNEINNIISNSCKEIKEKSINLNYLELLKYKLIDNITDLNLDLFKDLDNNQIETNNNFLDNNNLSFFLKFYNEPSSQIKKKIAKDTLSIILKGSKSLSIYVEKTTNISSELNLFAKTGIVISKNTVVNEKIFKDSIILDINNNTKNDNKVNAAN